MKYSALKIIELVFVNLITTTRLLGAFALPFIYVYHGPSVCALITIILFLTDAIDGFLARRLKISTFLGSMLDAFSDKLLNGISFIILGIEYNIMFAPLILELSILYTNYSTYRFGGNVQSSIIGKIKTVILDIFVILSFALLSLNAFNPEELQKCVRIFPHKMDGEGHFLALFRKKGDSLPPVFRFSAKGPDKNTRKWLEEFFSEIGLKTIGGQEFDWNRVEVRKDKVYYQLPFPLDLRGISFLRNGLYLGDLKKNRFEPSQPLALALHKGDVEAVISLPVSDERLTRYLKGETLMIEPEEAAHKKGWHLLCVDGYPLGFGKLVNGILKNKYPAGWRV